MRPLVSRYRQLNARERMIYELAAYCDRMPLLTAARAVWLTRQDDGIDSPRDFDALDDIELVAYIVGDRA